MRLIYTHIYIYAYYILHRERERSISFHITIPSSSFFRRIFLLDVPSFSTCFFPSLPIHGRHHSAPPGSAAPGSGSGIRAPNAVRPWYAPQSQPRVPPGSRAGRCLSNSGCRWENPMEIMIFQTKRSQELRRCRSFRVKPPCFTMKFWDMKQQPFQFDGLVWPWKIYASPMLKHVETIGPAAPPNTDPDSVWL